MLSKITYKELNSRQKENYNFHKVAAVLATYGFNSIWLNDDYQGADFLAIHIDDSTILKVQLKGRFTLDRKYNNKNIYIAFNHIDQWYLYPHDELQEKILKKGMLKGTSSWEVNGLYTFKKVTGVIGNLLDLYKIN